MEKIKHVFIINPNAGKNNKTKIEEFEKQIKEIFREKKFENDNYEIYVTISKKDATEYVKIMCHNKTEKINFYACGGDGTFNEVVNGVIGFDDVSVAIIPMGSGNDFVRNFAEKNDFLNVKNQLGCSTEQIDILKINQIYCANLCNIGFDAKVSTKADKFKKFPFIPGNLAYSLSIFYCIFNNLYTTLAIKIDDKTEFYGEYLLCVIGNGRFYGGGYNAAPLAKVNDGYIEVCLIKKISRLDLIKLFGLYKKGAHLNDERIKDYVIYTKCKKITLKSDTTFEICIDGEVFKDTTVSITIEEKKLSFLNPVI